MLKYVLGAYKIDVLKEIFPDIKFLVIKRDPTYIAQSLIIIRRQVFGNIDEWWSLKPREIDELKMLDPYEQVVAQVYYTFKELETKSKMYKEDFLYLKYEDIIKSPEVELNKIAKKFSLDFRKDYKLPEEKLSISKSQIVDDAEFKKIQENVEKYFGSNQG
jgi:hypothetical protein